MSTQLSKLKLPFFVLLAAVVIAATGMFLLSQLPGSQQVPNPSPLPTPPPTPISPSSSTPQAQELDTSGWLTYRNDEHGFELKYPKEATVTTEGGRTKINFLAKPNETLFEKYISIGVPDIESEECVLYKAYLSSTPGEFSELITVNGVEFLKYNVAELNRANTVSDHGKFISLQGDYCIDIAFMLTYRSPEVYEESKEAEEKFFEEILSTLRFLE